MQTSVTAGGDWVHFLPKRSAERAVYQLRQQKRHGERVQDIADARRLWARLDDRGPGGPVSPEEGFQTQS